MNFLAHAVLSFNDPELLAGNMISDFVKGRKKYDLPPAILAGVDLHRAIDEFTDNHPVNKQARSVFSPYRLYSASILDIIYDHFVANDPGLFADSSLEAFVKGVYTSLSRHESFFPPKFAAMFPYMKSQDWLYNYREEDGIYRSLSGLKRRASYIVEVETAFNIFLLEKKSLQEYYNRFFPDLYQFAKVKASELRR